MFGPLVDLWPEKATFRLISTPSHQRTWTERWIIQKTPQIQTQFFFFLPWSRKFLFSHPELIILMIKFSPCVRVERCDCYLLFATVESLFIDQKLEVYLNVCVVCTLTMQFSELVPSNTYVNKRTLQFMDSFREEEEDEEEVCSPTHHVAHGWVDTNSNTDTTFSAHLRWSPAPSRLLLGNNC